MTLVPLFEIPHGDRIAKNVKSLYIQEIPRSKANLETVAKKMRLSPKYSASKKSTILALLLRNFVKMTSS